MNYDEIEVTVNGTTLKWYTELGYTVPTHTVQLWAQLRGKRVKNGNKVRVAVGTKIVVKLKDLPPSSNQKITRICTSCSNKFTTTYGAYLKKEQSDRCISCAKKKIKGDGSHGYWVDKLIKNNQKAKCDISGEVDKRFLVLHHLDSRSNGGKNTPSNYVILSANYHLAFHTWNGGMNVLCTKEQYYEFRKQEM